MLQIDSAKIVLKGIFEMAIFSQCHFMIAIVKNDIYSLRVLEKYSPAVKEAVVKNKTFRKEDFDKYYP